MLFVTSSVCVTSCHTQLIIHKPYQAGKPGFAGRDRPKPSEAWKTGSGFEFDRPEASKSWAAEPAFRPSRAGKSLVSSQGNHRSSESHSSPTQTGPRSTQKRNTQAPDNLPHPRHIKKGRRNPTRKDSMVIKRNNLPSISNQR